MSHLNIKDSFIFKYNDDSLLSLRLTPVMFSWLVIFLPYGRLAVFVNLFDLLVDFPFDISIRRHPFDCLIS